MKINFKNICLLLLLAFFSQGMLNAQITVYNACGASTVDLSTHADPAPMGLVVTWHTGNPATTLNKVADSTQVGTGDYYAAYYDPINDCYGDVVGPVKVIIVTPPVATILEVDASCTVNDDIIAVGDSATLTASGGVSFLWSTTETTAGITVKPLATTTYVVTVTDSIGCTAVDSVEIQVVSPPSVSITPSSAIVINVGNNTSFTANGGLTYLWSTGETTATITVNPASTTTYTVTATDGNGCNTALGKLVTVNQYPVAINDSLTTDEDLALTGTIAANDSDIDGNLDNGSFSLVSSPLFGNLNFNSNGSFVYTPAVDFEGIDSIFYLVCDQGSPALCDSAWLFITVNAVNDPPLVAHENETTLINVALNGTVINGSDIDPEGTMLEANTTPVRSPSNGLITLFTDGSYTYTPSLNFVGIDTVVVAVCDNGLPLPAQCANDTLIINVVSFNTAPIAENDAVNANEDTPLSDTVAMNDGDGDGNLDPNSFAVVTPALNGAMTMNADGSYTYTPNANFNGLDSVQYRVCDLGFPIYCDTAWVVITVNAVNDAPLAVNDTLTTNEDTPLSNTVATNDSDVDGNLDNGSFSPLTNALHGTFGLASNGSFTYTPDPDFNGVDSVMYRVCDLGTPALCDTAWAFITVLAQNDPPVAVNDAATTNEDTPLSNTVATNDSDVDGNLDVTSFTALTTALNGALTLNPDGSYAYTPNANFHGLDSVQYSVCDLGTPALCDTAWLVITVNNVNDPPVALDDAISVDEDGSITSTVATNDTDADNDINPTGFTKLSDPTHGAIVFTDNGSFVYTPNANFNGVDSVQYSVCDLGTPTLCDTAWLVITVNSLVDAPIALDDNFATDEDTPVTGTVATNDTDADGNLNTNSFAIVTNTTNGNFVLNADGSFSYTPNANFNGLDSVQYQVCDLGAPVQCDTAWVFINVNAINDPPVALDDVLTTDEDTPASGTVATNDTDVDGNLNLNGFAALTNALNGTFTLNPDGTYTYAPNAHFNGVDSVQYAICDVGVPMLCDTAWLRITVNSVDDAPLAVNDTFRINENDPLSNTVASNDTDADGNLDNNSFSALTSALNGVFNLNNDGTFTYTPTSNFNGRDSLMYRVCDLGAPALCDTAWVFITVDAVDYAPLAINDTVTVNEDTPLSGTVATNDSDSDGNLNPNGFTKLNDPANGAVVFNADGTFTYTPNANFNGKDSIQYQICDLGTPTRCDTAWVVITVSPVNDTLIVSNDAITTTEEVAVSGSILNTFDYDPDGTPLTVNVTPVRDASNGTIVVASDGTYTYAPNFGFVGLDTVVLQVCDGGLPMPSLCANDTLFVTVLAGNEAPVAVVDSIVINEDITATGTVAANDTDVDANIDPNGFSALSSAIHGTFTLNANGTYSYVPTTNYYGMDSVQYRVCDLGTPSLCDTAWVIITVNPVNDPPVIVNDSHTTMRDVAANSVILTPSDLDPDGTMLVVDTIPVLNPANGTIKMNADGSYRYTPNSGFVGMDTMVLKVCDGGFPLPVLCGNDTLIITVLPVNDPPIAQDNVLTIQEDTQLNGTVASNDSDPNGNIDANSFFKISGPRNGTLTFSANGDYSYTPNANFNGVDSVQYMVCDLGMPIYCDTAWLIVTVSAVNDAPVAINDTVVTSEDVPLSGTVASNDTDADGNLNPSGFTRLTDPTHGTITFNADGSYIFTPTTHFYGYDSIQYAVCDLGTPSLCDTAWLFITINPVNDAPVAVDDAVNVDEDGSTTGTVATNDSDVDGDLNPNGFTKLTEPTRGAIVFNANGSYTYTPNANFNGKDSIQYAVCDLGTPSLCDTAWLVFTVLPANDAPVAVKDEVSTNEDTPLSSTVASNDTDTDGNLNPNGFAKLTDPISGTIVFNADGSYTYTPSANFNGLDSIKYTVCDLGTPALCDSSWLVITVNAVNDAPVAANDAATTQENTPISGTVATNDTDVDGNLNPSGFTKLDGPTNGTIVFNPNGTYTYTPTANFNGRDTVRYAICDLGTPSLCDTATLVITVGAVNEAPIAVNDAATTNEDTPLSNTVATNDSDVDGNLNPNGFAKLTEPTRGTIVFNANGSYTYTPNANFNGKDSIQYAVCDLGTPSLCDTAWLVITVNAVNDAPIALNDVATTNEDSPVSGTVATNDSDVDGNLNPNSFVRLTDALHGILMMNPNGSYSYMPTANFNGKDSVQYTVCDLGTPSLCDTAWLVITVNPVNNAPVAVNDATTTEEDTPVSGTVATNDTDVDGNLNPNGFAKLTDPTNGAILFNADGTYTYAPSANFNGKDSIQYAVCDLGTPSLCDTAWLVITVNAVNDPPIVVNQTKTTTQGTPTTGSILTIGLDLDPEGTILLVETNPVKRPSNGTVTIATNGTYTYTPNAGFVGKDTIVFRVCDNGLPLPIQCSNDTLFVDVQAVNVPPVAVNDAATTEEDTPLSSTVALNDTDADGNLNPNGFTKLTNPANGTIVFNANGSYVYTPNANFNGKDSVQYAVCDLGTPALCDTAWLIITVNAANDAPVANVDGGTTNEDTPLNINVLSNDSDPEESLSSSNLTAIVTQPRNGIATINGDGTIMYVPMVNFNGKDSLVYRLCDTGTPQICDTAIVFITVNPVNDAPVAQNDATTTPASTAVNGTVATNDSDVDGNLNPNGFTKLTDPAHGTIVFNANGSYTYTPNAGFSGLDSIQYAVCDLGAPSLCDTAWLVITVNATTNTPPIVLDDIGIGIEDAPILIPVLDNDVDTEGGLDTTSVTIVQNPKNGTAVINPNGSISYTPNPNFNGSDTLVYRVCDKGTPPLCDTARVVITVNAANDAPIATLDSVSTEIDTPVSIVVLNNDSDIEGPLDTTSVTITQAPKNGTATVDTLGRIVYTPNATFTGLDTLIYRVCDKGTPLPILCDTAMVIIRVTGANLPPIAANDTLTTAEGTPLTGTVATNDSDPDNVSSELTYTALDTVRANQGLLIFNPDGTFIFVPQDTFSGDVVVRYKVCDPKGLCDTAVLVIKVTPAVDANDDTAETEEGTTVVIDITQNDSGTSSGNFTFGVVANPNSGTVTYNNGQITYEPKPNFCNSVTPDSFTYAICRGTRCDTAKVSILVACKGLKIFTGFSPNGDGVNDFLTISGIENFPDNRLCVYNRWGNEVLNVVGYKNNWDGKWNEQVLPDGTYFYIFDDGKGKVYKGYIQIQR